MKLILEKRVPARGIFLLSYVIVRLGAVLAPPAIAIAIMASSIERGLKIAVA